MRADKDILLHRYLLSNISVPFCSQEHGNKKNLNVFQLMNGYLKSGKYTEWNIK